MGERQLTYSEAIAEGLSEEMERDKNIYLIGQDIKTYGIGRVAPKLLGKFDPTRFIEAPVSEGIIVGSSIGAAMMGFRPVAEVIFSDFSALVLDLIHNYASKVCYFHLGRATCPMVIRLMCGGGGGKGFGPQHSQSLEAWFCHTPGLKVCMPSTPEDAKGLIKSALRDDNPVIFYEHRRLYGLKGSVPEGELTIPLGEADIKREGEDVTIIATSAMVHEALEAAEELEREGIDAEVVDPRTLMPLDREALLKSVRKTGRAVVVHEACLSGGIGGEIAAILAADAFDDLRSPVRRIGAPDIPIPANPWLEARYFPDRNRIVEAVRGLL
jgi:pyruvate dehydrogenase E1 component beta subunit